jgi:hypothetical protein
MRAMADLSPPLLPTIPMRTPFSWTSPRPIGQRTRSVLWACVLPISAASAATGEQCLQNLYQPTQVGPLGAVGAIAMADYNGDGIDDTWIVGSAAGQMRILLGASAGAPQEIQIPVGVGPVALAFGDVDGDGDQDGLVVLEGTGFQFPGQGFRLLRNRGPSHWTLDALTPFPAGDSGPVEVFLRDTNGDGRLDLLVALRYHQNTGGLLVGLGAGDFSFNLLATQPLPSSPQALDAADLNGDGQLDLAVLFGGLVSYAHTVYFGAGDGSFGAGGVSLSGGFYSSAIVAGDWDQDGAPDLAVGSKYAVATFKNNGSGFFSPWTAVNYGYYIKSLASGDMDGDGDLDLVAVSGSSQALRVLGNNGQGQFSIAASLPTSLQSYALALGDTNADGHLDAWAGDVVTGAVNGALSHCVLATYGNAKPTSAGSLPALGASGSASLSVSGFTVTAAGLPSSQPAWVGIALGSANLPFLGGSLLLDNTLQLVPSATSAGSGNPLLTDGGLALAITPQPLATLGLGAQVFVQVLALDPLQTDGTLVALTDGLRFEIVD